MIMCTKGIFSSFKKKSVKGEISPPRSGGKEKRKKKQEDRFTVPPIKKSCFAPSFFFIFIFTTCKQNKKQQKKNPPFSLCPFTLFLKCQTPPPFPPIFLSPHSRSFCSAFLFLFFIFSIPLQDHPSSPSHFFLSTKKHKYQNGILLSSSNLHPSLPPPSPSDHSPPNLQNFKRKCTM